MNDNVLDALLMYCLDELEAGVPVEEILARYPEQAAVIRPLLEVAVQLSQLAPEPPPKAQAASQAVFLAHAKAMKKAYRQPRMGNAGWRRLALLFGAVVLVIVAFLAVSEQTAAALPGSAFYPVKRVAEDLRLSLTDDQRLKEELRTRYDAERVKEINTLLTIGREAQVECRGTIDEMGPETWILCGLAAIVNAETIIEGNPFVGAVVEVKGVVANGRFTVMQIFVLTGNEPTIVPATATPRPPTPAPPTPTETAVPIENTPTPSTTPTETATATPPLEATDTPELDDDDDTPEPEDDDDGEETPEPDDDDGEETPEPDDDDNSGPGGGDDDNSGPGSGDDDNSGSGSSGSNSGSGSGGDDDDNSGSGGNSGPGGGN